jgi:hypothetical protein
MPGRLPPISTRRRTDLVLEIEQELATAMKHCVERHGLSSVDDAARVYLDLVQWTATLIKNF